MTTPSAQESYEEITVELKDGTKIYWPKGDMSRLAPAVVCAILQRLVDLRRVLKLNAAKIPADVLSLLERAAAPVPLESEFTSGDVVRLHNAVVDAGSGLVPSCDHQYEVSSPVDTVEVCIRCGDRRPV